MGQYKVQLRQQAWVTVEEFTYDAKDEKDAIKQAQQFINDEKEYEDGSYKLTAQDVTPQEDTPEEGDEDGRQ